MWKFFRKNVSWNFSSFIMEKFCLKYLFLVISASHKKHAVTGNKDFGGAVFTLFWYNFIHYLIWWAFANVTIETLKHYHLMKTSQLIYKTTQSICFKRMMTFQLVFLVMKLKCHQLISLLMSCLCLPIWAVTFSEACTSKSNNFLTLYLSANPTKWSITLKQFVDCCRRMVWVCLTILWGWRIKTHPEPIQTSKIDLLLLFS